MVGGAPWRSACSENGVFVGYTSFGGEGGGGSIYRFTVPAD
jgi:hypothetical protein